MDEQGLDYSAAILVQEKSMFDFLIALTAAGSAAGIDLCLHLVQEISMRR